MKNIFSVIFLGIILFSATCYAQSDSLKVEKKAANKAFLKLATLPTGIIVTGIIMDKGAIRKPIQYEIQNSLNGFRT